MAKLTCLQAVSLSILPKEHLVLSPPFTQKETVV